MLISSMKPPSPDPNTIPILGLERHDPLIVSAERKILSARFSMDLFI